MLARVEGGLVQPGDGVLHLHLCSTMAMVP